MRGGEGGVGGGRSKGVCGKKEGETVERMEQDGEKEQGEKEFKPVRIERKIMIAASCMLI